MCCYDQRGLGRTARTLDIASSLASRFSNCSILVLSNLSIVGRFRTPLGVDVVRVPSIGLSAAAEGGVRRAALERECAIAIRRTLAERVIESFQPDLVVIDRDPTHLPSEIQPVLSFVREKLPRTRVVWALPVTGSSSMPYRGAK